MEDLTVTQALQINKALQVLQMLTNNPKMTQEKACANVGISAPTYRKWISTQDDALISFEQARTEMERNEYSAILVAKSAVVSGLIHDAMKSSVPIGDRIKALQHMEKRLDQLSDQYHTIDIEAEEGLLNGPKQTPGISKLANRVSVEEQGNETIIKIKDKPDIIDTRFTDATPALESG